MTGTIDCVVRRVTLLELLHGPSVVITCGYTLYLVIPYRTSCWTWCEPVEALLDSEAMRCIMSAIVYRGLRLSHCQTHYSQAKCLTATAQKFSAESVLTCRTRINRYTSKFIFYVFESLVHP